MVAEEGSVPKYVATSAHMHGVAEVPQWRADHVQREVSFKAALAVGVGHETFEARQLLLEVHVQTKSNQNQPEKLSTFSPDAGIVEFSSQKVCLIPEIRSFGRKKHVKVELQADVMSRLTSVPAPGACTHSWLEHRGRSAVPPGCCSAGWSVVSNCRQQLTNRSSCELLCGHAVEPSVEMERKNTSVI